VTTTRITASQMKLKSYDTQETIEFIYDYEATDLGHHPYLLKEEGRHRGPTHAQVLHSTNAAKEKPSQEEVQRATPP
jgi:hypothetical protein